jgi:putative DNA methylase
MSYSKKLIEVALPLDAINAASAREKSIRHGHPSTLHLWWARRPLAAARAVIFAQMVDDPSAHPEQFPTEAEQERERLRLFAIIEKLVKWENTTNEDVLNQARAEIWKSWRATCARARETGFLGKNPVSEDSELYAPDRLPAFHDPFAGGGALPLEAQRLGLEAYASDLNPVAVLINKAMIEIPPKFANRPPVNPEARGGLFSRQDLQDSQDSQDEKKKKNPVNPVNPVKNSVWRGAQGLAEDVRYYGQWMRDEAAKRIGHLYPTVAAVQEKDGAWRHATPDEIRHSPSAIRHLTVIAWLWARTVKSPNPAFADVDVPLASTFILSSKPGKEAYVEPVIFGQDSQDFQDGKGDFRQDLQDLQDEKERKNPVNLVNPVKSRGYAFTVKVGKPPERAKNGTKLARGANFQCLLSGSPIASDYIKAEGKAGRMGARLMAIVAAGDRGRVYLAPTPEHEAIARQAQPTWKPETAMPIDRRWFSPPLYGMPNYGDIFTPRQLVALTTFSDMVTEARERVRHDALAAGLPDDDQPLAEGGTGAQAYADAVAVYLAFAQSKACNRNTSLCLWEHRMDRLVATFGRQALPMVWDFAETNPLAGAGGDIFGCVQSVCEVIEKQFSSGHTGEVFQADAVTQNLTTEKIVSTDPPYYDNIGYADLSDFFYIWLRRSLKPVFPNIFTTLAVPKDEELVATPYRHGSKEKAETFFLKGMTQAMHRLARQSHPSFPVSIYYAFKQSENNEATGTTSTGWETFLAAIICAGFSISGTWPMRTEQPKGLRAFEQNALASSIILVCRKRPDDAPTATRREFLAALRAELPGALKHLQRGNIAPVDLAQAAIGPGMGVFTRYARVLDAAGQAMSVREALALINQTLDEVLAEQEGDFDAETRWAVAWFEQMGFNDGPFGDAETLSKAKNTSVEGMVEAGLLLSKAGKVRLLRPAELSDKAGGAVWLNTHRLIQALEQGGETAAAAHAAALGSQADSARELAYRLYTVCERKKRAAEALAYNGLVQSWPEIVRLAAEKIASGPRQEGLFGQDLQD